MGTPDAVALYDGVHCGDLENPSGRRIDAATQVTIAADLFGRVPYRGFVTSPVSARVLDVLPRSDSRWDRRLPLFMKGRLV